MLSSSLAKQHGAAVNMARRTLQSKSHQAAALDVNSCQTWMSTATRNLSILDHVTTLECLITLQKVMLQPLHHTFTIRSTLLSIRMLQLQQTKDDPHLQGHSLTHEHIQMGTLAHTPAEALTGGGRRAPGTAAAGSAHCCAPAACSPSGHPWPQAHTPYWPSPPPAPHTAPHPSALTHLLLRSTFMDYQN